MPFPRFMLMRGSLRGNGNHSLDNPLEQDQAAASTSPAWEECAPSHREQPPGCITCVLGITHPQRFWQQIFILGRVLPFPLQGKVIGNKPGFPGYGELCSGGGLGDAGTHQIPGMQGLQRMCMTVEHIWGFLATFSDTAANLFFQFQEPVSVILFRLKKCNNDCPVQGKALLIPHSFIFKSLFAIIKNSANFHTPSQP